MWVSRAITVSAVTLSFASLFVVPPTWWWAALDVLLRTYLMFIGMVMAHEAAHGHLARTRRANDWWGRFALLPVMVGFENFRRTHLLHHAHTNDPEHDPDFWLATPREWEIPLRALTMPQQWIVWLARRGKLKRAALLRHVANWAVVFGVYAGVFAVIGWQRFVIGVGLPMVLVSLLLWYVFAVRTHAGYSRGPAETRSHDYYGHWMYWLSCGLSLHRVHHMNPALPWLHMRPFVAAAPGGLWRRLMPRRDIRREKASVPVEGSHRARM